MSEFPAAPLDRTTRRVTAGTVVIVLGVMLSAGLSAKDPAGRAITIGIGPLIIVLAWGYAPAAFAVRRGTLEVRRRLFGRQRFTVTGRAHLPRWRIGLTSVRKFGSGGLFGWYGAFWRPGMGSFRAYVTDRSRAVLCETDKGPVIVSPVDADGFLAALDEVHR